MNAADIRREIDRGFPTTVHEALPALPLGHAECPDHQDLSGGREGHCTFVVAGLRLPLIVSVDGRTAAISFRPDGSIIDMSRVAAFGQSFLIANYRRPARVSCDGARYRVVAANAIVTCTIHGSTYPPTLRLKVLPTSGLFAYFPDGIPKPKDPTSAWIQAHKRGRVIVAGDVAAARIRSSIAISRATVPSSSYGPVIVRCPPRLDLTGAKRGICAVTVDGLTVHVALFIDGDDWREHQLDDVIKKSVVEQTASKHYSEMLVAHGQPGMVAVTCPIPAVRVMTYPVTLDCRIQANGEKPERLTISRQDSVSYVNYDVEDL